MARHPTKTPTPLPPSPWPHSRQHSRRIRCCGSVVRASRALTPKHSASNRARSRRKPPYTRWAGLVEPPSSVRIPSANRSKGLAVTASPPSLPARSPALLATLSMTATGILTPLGSSSCTPPGCPCKGCCVLRTGRRTSSWSWSMLGVFPWCSSSSFRRLHLIVLSTGQSFNRTVTQLASPLPCLPRSLRPARPLTLLIKISISWSIAATSRVCTSSTIRVLVPLFDRENHSNLQRFYYVAVMNDESSYVVKCEKKEIHI